MQSKIILITGSTDGIGLETASQLIKDGHKVILHGRNSKRVREAKDKIEKRQAGSVYDTAIADFEHLQSVKNMAHEILKQYDHIDVLINNAGIFCKNRIFSADGYERTFAVNHLAHVLLTLELLPLIKNAEQGRIVVVSSMIHSTSLDFNNLQGEKHYDGNQAYSRSKLANLLFANYLSAEMKDTAVTVNSLHPGVISTKLLNASFGPFGKPVSNGIKNSVYLATNSAVSEVTGEYFDNLQITAPAPIAEDYDTQKRLWEISQKMIDKAINR